MRDKIARQSSRSVGLMSAFRVHLRQSKDLTWRILVMLSKGTVQMSFPSPKFATIFISI